MYKNLWFSLALLPLLLMVACSQSDNENTEAGAITVQTGAEVLLNEQIDLLEGKRAGLVTNHSAVVDDEHLIDLLQKAGVEITALFGPEHGIRGDADAGAKIEDGVDQQTGAPIYSLYGENEKPSAEMLQNVDVLIFDIQDVGARFYTYTSTMGYAMQSAAEQGIPFMVLDRPNPLGGNSHEGFVLEPGFETFVGLYPIPVSHSLTVGELARMIKGEGWLEGLEELDLQVVEMKNWSRDMLWPETGLEWIPPSPNIPTFDIALIYPGACFFERTTASEGRGTMQPFQQLGAPWIDSEQLALELNSRNLPGLEFEAISFTPKSIEGMDADPDWEGEEVHGVKYVITDRDEVEPVAAGVHVLQAFYNMSMEEGEVNFLSESVRSLAGTDRLYNMISKGIAPSEIIDSWSEELAQFEKQRQPYLLYD